MEILHVLNRGVDKRRIFLDDEDRYRFIHDMFEFNDLETTNTSHFFARQYYDVRRRNIGVRERKPRKLLVKVLAFCVMPNHYHMLLMPARKNGVVLFMKKLNGGYAKYFNEKYDRQGTLFQSRYKKIPVTREAHFTHLPYYIHLNPLDLEMPGWRSREINDYRKAMKFLKSYRWSSHLDYLGIKNFPSVTQRDFLLEFFGGHKEYERSIKNWLQELDLEKFKEMTLEDKV